MKFVPGDSTILQVRPRGGRLPASRSIPLHPGTSTIVKNEHPTLVWREFLPDGREMAVKFYGRKPWTWWRSRLTVSRVRHEFDGLSRLESLGIPCSPPLFWCLCRYPGQGLGEILATEWIPGCEDLETLFARVPGSARTINLDPLFRDIRRMHEGGFQHGALYMRNVLLRGDPANSSFVFIDMPRCHPFRKSIAGSRMARYDLLFLCEMLVLQTGQEIIRKGLAAYGMSPDEQESFMEALRRFKNTPRCRRIIGAEFNLRALISC